MLNNETKDIIILAIESSCDDTSASVIKNGMILSNIVSSQIIHSQYGGVVPELASRAHQKNILPVIEEALAKAKVNKNMLHAIAFTQGPGLLGSLLVGSGVAKSMSYALDIPLIGVNHMEAHVMAPFAYREDQEIPNIPLPLLCLTVSGGHTQLVLLDENHEFKIVGETRDDAAGEAFDKIAKLMGLPYPGGPMIDKLSKQGDFQRFSFAEPEIPELDFSFSGFKSSFMRFLEKEIKADPEFLNNNKADIAASVQYCIVNILIKKYKKAIKMYNPKSISIAGGVAANSLLRKSFIDLASTMGMSAIIPDFEYCTDNAGMIAVVAHQKYLKKKWTNWDQNAQARWK